MFHVLKWISCKKADYKWISWKQTSWDRILKNAFHKAMKPYLHKAHKKGPKFNSGIIIPIHSQNSSHITISVLKAPQSFLNVTLSWHKYALHPQPLSLSDFCTPNILIINQAWHLLKFINIQYMIFNRTPLAITHNNPITQWKNNSQILIDENLGHSRYSTAIAKVGYNETFANNRHPQTRLIISSYYTIRHCLN